MLATADGAVAGSGQRLATIDEMLDGKDNIACNAPFGVTNSGKTEVYLQATAKAFGAAKSAIVLVLEISLTPQTVRRFRARFGDRLSVLAQPVDRRRALGGVEQNQRGRSRYCGGGARRCLRRCATLD